MLISTPSYNPSIQAYSFSLHDVVSGEQFVFNVSNNKNPFVIAFICNHCPYVQEVIVQLVDFAKKLKKEGISLYAIMPNNYEFVHLDNPENMKIFADQFSFTFPYLIDETQEVARSYGAVCTPDFFGFNTNGEMRYRGRIDELYDAMLEIQEKGEYAKAQHPSKGCSIKWK